MMNLLIWFLVGFIAGFVLLWFAAIDDSDTGFVIFESEEELDEMCWSGLRNPK